MPRSERPRLLDLFCGAGGCSVGYERAGFDVVGVDIDPHKDYPFEFIQADAMTYPLDGFDAIHASPPCQAYSLMTRNKGTAHTFPDLVAPTRARLVAAGVPYVIENVIGAPMENAVMICGASLGLGSGVMELHRHRLFECSFPAMGLQCSRQKSMSIGVYGNGTNSWHREKLGRNVTVAEMREAMGIDWMTRSDLNQAIPPAYTEHIGEYLMRALDEQATRDVADEIAALQNGTVEDRGGHWTITTEEAA